MFSSFLEKQSQVKSFFKDCLTADQKYQKIMELGKQLEPYPEEFKTKEYLVSGCQSVMYLHASIIDGKIHFRAYSEALISAGLASLMLTVYNQEFPETVLKCPPSFLEDLGISSLLSPGRSHGLASLYLRMQQLALQALAARS